jgi:hypothetical protein
MNCHIAAILLLEVPVREGLGNRCHAPTVFPRIIFKEPTFKKFKTFLKNKIIILSL